MIRPIAAALAFLLAPVCVTAQEAKPPTEAASDILKERAEDVAAVLRGEKQAEAVFAPAFLAAVPATQLSAIGEQLAAQFGAFVGVERVEASSRYQGTIYLRFEKAIGSGNLALLPDEPNMVGGLLLQSFEPIDDNADKIAADLAALPGEVSVLFGPLADGAEPIMSINPDAQLALGSTFKLYVLSALARSIENGERNWNDVVELNVKSFPSGRLQSWPEGSPLTLQSLASLMISVSDNTATDQLIRVLGREAIEAEAAQIGHSDPAGLMPFLTTLELFALKADKDLGTRFAEGDEAEQRAVLDELRALTGWTTDNISGPTFVEPTMIDTLEWFANTGDIAKLMDTLARYEDQTVRDVMAINPSMPKAIRERWAYIGYKGGSEPGVLNLSWLLFDKNNAAHVLTMSWSNSEAGLDNSTFELLAQRIVALAE
ncbi:serine hydrolase [Parerythrobacter jejuensis]|uniref:Serine hydrolase n=1 Tax=Parerythrobacter jejuensis TaxID=795812 RepID=A0A845AV09_9SPHN|nr:serine hydrolase [Parerythrobacter jejuensis]MXP32336.1 serine hydrolase [Parerythrobacter jejuensis]